MGHHHHHHGHHHHGMNDPAMRGKEIRDITLLGAALDGVLGLAKVIIGSIGHSHALVADGVHSFSDLFTDIIVLLAAKHAHKQADDDHPYGHGRIETLATGILSAILFGVAVGILWNAILIVTTNNQIEEPTTLTVILAILSVASKELIYHLTMRVARRTESKILEANAWHSRSDAFSSVIVIIGIVGVWMGWGYLDAVAAIVVACIIAKVSWDFGWPAIQELIDTSVDNEEQAKIKSIIANVEGVISLHMLRTRKVGTVTFLDVHVQVAPTISVSEGHEIGERIRRNLHLKLGADYDLTLHIDPEDDGEARINCVRPSRDQIHKDLQVIFDEFTPGLTPQVKLHYLRNTIEIELFYDAANHADVPAKALITAIEQLEYIHSATINLTFAQ